MPIYFQKPENALKRANEFIDVGKKEAALDVLYDVIKSKKHRNWQKIHEPILKQYLDLCVELKRSVNAKEGLYQYKLICQQVNIASLEDVISHFLKLAEDTAEKARLDSRELVTVEDLDQLQTPEGILLSSVSAEDTQDRTDRIMLTPWVKFLWEAYRNVLDLLRNNNRVEKLYQETAQQAFKFCLKYVRRTEFRKLCDHIRNHLEQVKKYQGQPTAINLSNPDTLQAHLETRLAQLDSSIAMELWQEAFKAVQDVHHLIKLSKKPPKPHMLANFYEKMALVFRKAGSNLFHAATLHRQFTLFREQKKTITQEELQKISSKVLLATLAVNICPGKSAMEEYLSYDDDSHEKAKKLADLLGLQNVPTRNSLIKDMINMNVLNHVAPELNNLYHSLEIEFRPLKLCKKINGILDFIEEQNEEVYKLYITPLKKITIIRMLKQIAQVYNKMTFAKLKCLVPFATEHQLERAIVDGVKDGELQLSIDHRLKQVNFGSDFVVAMKEEVPEGPYVQSMHSEVTRNQLCQMSEGLFTVVKFIYPVSLQRDRYQLREQLVQQYLRQERKEHAHILNRKSTIEARKEKIENLKNELERMEQAKIQQQQVKLKEAEQKRLEEERLKRAKERERQEYQRVRKQQVIERVKTLTETEVGKKAFKGLTTEEIEQMDEDDILRRQVEQLDKEKRELSVKLKTQEKKIDHMARAMRREVMPALEAQYKEQAVKDQAFWKKEQEEKISTAKAEHDHAVTTKQRLTRMEEDKEKFLADLAVRKESEHTASVTAFEERLSKIRQEKMEERRKQRVADRKRCYLEEKRETKRKLEEEKIRKEKEEADRKVEEEAAAKKKAEEERMQKFADMERKQKERERQIEEKQSREKSGALDAARGLRDREEERSREDVGRSRDVGGRGREEGDGWRRGDDRTRDRGRDEGDGWRKDDERGDPGRDSRGGSEEKSRDAPSRDTPLSRDPPPRDNPPITSDGRYIPPSMRARLAKSEDSAPRQAESDSRDSDRNRDSGNRDRDQGLGDRDRGFGDRDRDRGLGDRDRAGGRDLGGDRDRGMGDRDRDRGFGGDRDRDRGFGGDRDRGFGGDRDRRFGGDRDRGFGGDRDRDRGFGGDRDRNRGFGGDRDRDRGFGGDRDRDRGFGGDRDRDRGFPDRGRDDRNKDRDRDSGFGRTSGGGGGGGGGWGRDRDGGTDSPGNWRRGGDDGPAKSEGRSWQASRVSGRPDRERERDVDREKPSNPEGTEDDGWTTVRR